MDAGGLPEAERWARNRSGCTTESRSEPFNLRSDWRQCAVSYSSYIGYASLPLPRRCISAQLNLPRLRGARDDRKRHDASMASPMIPQPRLREGILSKRWSSGASVIAALNQINKNTGKAR
jgi:hypothetical protein